MKDIDCRTHIRHIYILSWGLWCKLLQHWGLLTDLLSNIWKWTNINNKSSLAGKKGATKCPFPYYRMILFNINLPCWSGHLVKMVIFSQMTFFHLLWPYEIFSEWQWKYDTFQEDWSDSEIKTYANIGTLEDIHH